MLDIEKKIAQIKEKFAPLHSNDERIRYILDLGRTLPPFPLKDRIEANQVSGCQSVLYLTSRLTDGKLFFQSAADALLSAGLAALLIEIYSGETPQIILKTPPDFLANLGILGSLTFSRSNGLAHIHQRIKKDALKFLISGSKPMEFNSSPG